MVNGESQDELLHCMMLVKAYLSSGNTPDVASKLHKALQYLSDAAETYTKVR